MNPNQAAQLLAIAAAYDNRKPDTSAAQAWAVALDGLRLEDCREVVIQHYRGSTEWIMPSHVIAGVRRLRLKRLDGHEPPDPPPGLDADDTAAYLRWLGESRRAIADGEVPAPPPELPSHPMPELRALMAKAPPVSRAVVAAETKRAKDPNFDANLARVRDELAGRREIPMRGDVDTEGEEAAG